MKKFKAIISLMLAAMLLIAPGINNLHVSAAERKPVTYVIKYVDKFESWRYQISENGTWIDSDYIYTPELYYMEQTIKDGDLIVVDGSGGTGPEVLHLKLPVALNNVTYNHSTSVIISAKSVENVYVLRDSVGIVNGDVLYAYVYDNAIANFNNNVGCLFVVEASSYNQSIGVVGTVLYAEENRIIQGIKRFYSFKKGKFYVKEGVLKSKPGEYSLTPPPIPAN